MAGTQGLRAQIRHSMHDVSVHVANIRPARSVTAAPQEAGQRQWGTASRAKRVAAAAQSSHRSAHRLPLHRSEPCGLTSFWLLGVQVGLEAVGGRIAQADCGGRRAEGGGEGGDAGVRSPPGNAPPGAPAPWVSPAPEKSLSSATNTSQRRSAVTLGIGPAAGAVQRVLQADRPAHARPGPLKARGEFERAGAGGRGGAGERGWTDRRARRGLCEPGR